MGKTEGRPSRGYLPTLDGWRAISIIAVIFSHDKVREFGPFHTSFLHSYGHIGVDVFFAISGLLITSRLLSEEQARGSISIPEFYIRRGFRILPPALLYLAVLLLLAVTVALPVNLIEVIASICFVRNYTFFLTIFGPLRVPPIYTGHFWSLAVEEHFYLFLPALLVFAPKRWRIPSLLALSVAVMLHRLQVALWGTPQPEFHSDLRLDALLVPAAIAVALGEERFRLWLTPKLKFWPLVAGAIVVAGYFDHGSFLLQTALAWLLPFVVLGTMLRPSSLISRVLELRVPRYIGRISYSLYLWQQLFFIENVKGAATAYFPPTRWIEAMAELIACALFSYYVVERPLIRVGHKVASRFVVRREAPALSANDAEAELSSSAGRLRS